MPDEQKREMVELLAGREIPLIEDDIFGDLAYARPRPKVCKAYDTKGLVLLCSSYSKTLAPGARLGDPEGDERGGDDEQHRQKEVLRGHGRQV